MKLAILLYGETSQKDLIGKIHTTLQHQLDQVNSKDIEVITYHDAGEKSDEEKKQWLLEQTMSKNYVFITPTTLLPDNFLGLRFNALKHHKPTKELVELGIFRKEVVQK